MLLTDMDMNLTAPVFLTITSPTMYLKLFIRAMLSEHKENEIPELFMNSFIMVKQDGLQFKWVAMVIL